MTTPQDALISLTTIVEAAAGYSASPTPTGDGTVRLRTIRTPNLRKMVKGGFDFISGDEEADLALWTHIWETTAYMEIRSMALYAYQHRTLSQRETRQLIRWADQCDCWEHSDDLAKIYAEMVEAKPTWVLPTLKKWNSAKDPWKRRLSMTSLIEYATKRTTFLPYDELMAFVLPLIDDPEYYVQKGLGWTVREIGNAYPAEFARFMEDHAAQLSPQAWTGATKNLPAGEKSRLKAIRQGK